MYVQYILSTLCFYASHFSKRRLRHDVGVGILVGRQSRKRLIGPSGLLIVLQGTGWETLRDRFGDWVRDRRTTVIYF